MLKRNRQPRAEPEMTEVVATSGGEPVSVPTAALRAITTALLPVLMKHGSVNLTIGTPPAPPERPRGLLAGSGRRGASRKLGHVVSVRADAGLLNDITRIAMAEGTTVSDWIRRAAAAAVFEHEKPAAPPGYRVTGWACPHINMTGGGGSVTVGWVTTGCDCEMQPIYEPVPLAA